MSDGNIEKNYRSKIPLGKSNVYFKGKPEPIEKQPEKYIKRGKVATPSEINRIRREVQNGKCNNPDVAILSAYELQRMRQEAVIHTQAEKDAQQKILNEQLEKQQAKGQAKRKRMMELEAEKKKLAPALSDLEKEDLQKKSALRKRAEELTNENRDEVKKMNQLINYAKCATVREKQIEEKDRIRRAKIEEEKRKDLMMEVERLKKIEEAEAEVKKRKTEIYEGRQVITEQIKDREVQRMMAKEEQAKEAVAMLRHIKQLEIEEQQSRLKARELQKTMLDEIYEANQNAIEKKHTKIMREREEDEKIVKFNIEKAQKEAEFAAEQKRIRDDKERETARLREMQEKAQDRQSEIDAIRAKRAMEKAERQARERERKEAELRALRNKELTEARRLQALEKERLLQTQALQDRDEFQKIIETQKELRDLEMRAERERQAKIKEHAVELRKQIAVKEENGLQNTRQKYESGKQVKDYLKSEHDTLAKLKAQKLAEMRALGIPDKYQVDLVKMKV